MNRKMKALRNRRTILQALRMDARFTLPSGAITQAELDARIVSAETLFADRGCPMTDADRAFIGR
jgi:hypothetical protein